MSEWYEVTNEDIDFDLSNEEVDILLTTNDNGNVYLTLGFNQVIEMNKNIPTAFVNGAWQPIETAPKDGTKILGYGVHEDDCGFPENDIGQPVLGACEIYFSIRENKWYSIINYTSHPTHWMPLPKPPTTTGEV